MQPQRTAITDSLADLLHILRMGEKSGVLTVERGDGRTLEEGRIEFLRGQVVEARVNQQRGPAAFTYLSSWQVCRFSFLAQVDNDAQLPPQIMQPRSSARSNVADNASIANPTYFHALKQAEQADQLYDYSDIPAMQFAMPIRLAAGEEMLQHPDHQGRLPRIHRRLLLLVDGQRSVSQLARLMGRSVEELQKLLNDLERSGLIRQ